MPCLLSLGFHHHYDLCHVYYHWVFILIIIYAIFIIIGFSSSLLLMPCSLSLGFFIIIVNAMFIIIGFSSSILLMPCLLSLGFLHHYNFMQCPYVPADECCDHSACYTGIALARTIYIHVYDRILVISLPKKLYIHRIYMA